MNKWTVYQNPYKGQRHGEKLELILFSMDEIERLQEALNNGYESLAKSIENARPHPEDETTITRADLMRTVSQKVS
jgi:hypothetical protein